MSRHGSLVRTALALAAFLLIATWTQTGRADSVWKQPIGEPRTLYATSKGEYKIGDVITILIVTDVSATNNTKLNTGKDSDLKMGFTNFKDIFGLKKVFGQPISANPQLELNASDDFTGNGSSSRSSAVTGTISGQVTEILPNGNLRIEASQTTVVNDEKNSVILIGTIRPHDITSQNTILSTQISNAEIRYSGKGPLSTVQKRGVIREFLEFIWPF
jgi:flagellar L-ring protein precursor FlgH